MPLTKNLVATKTHAGADGATGCFNGVYYASAESQLDEMRAAVDQVDDNVFLAKLAVYAGDLSARWDLLADAAKGPLVWKAIARQMGPQALRMNLNTLLRHEVLNDREMVDYVAGQA